jgi:hypothetical protein
VDTLRNPTALYKNYKQDLLDLQENTLSFSFDWTH